MPAGIDISFGALVRGERFFFFFSQPQMFGSADNPYNLSKITYVRAGTQAAAGDRFSERLLASILWQREET